MVDDWHRRGLGAALVQQLTAHASHAGIRRFTTLLAADNDAAIGLLRHTAGNQAELLSIGFGALEYTVALPELTAPFARWR